MLYSLNKKNKHYREHRKKLLEKLLDIQRESKLLKEVKDILDEIKMVKSVLEDQFKVLEGARSCSFPHANTTVKHAANTLQEVECNFTSMESHGLSVQKAVSNLRLKDETV